MLSDWDEIDWEDESGSIAFREWKKRNESREKTKEEFKGKSVGEIVDYAHDAYPEYATKAIANRLF